MISAQTSQSLYLNLICEGVDRLISCVHAYRICLVIAVTVAMLALNASDQSSLGGSVGVSMMQGVVIQVKQCSTDCSACEQNPLADSGYGL